ncbi:MAG: ribokinase [Dehalococcoidia bacterium]|nr:ribokinase [Dehalococcoidia bacterium]
MRLWCAERERGPRVDVSKTAPTVVVVGGVNTDMVVQTPHLPRPGETVGGGSFLNTHGGKGANQAVAAARLGATVRLIGRVGHDLFGESASDNLRRFRVDTAGLGRDSREPSGVALIFVDSAGENAIAVAPGANMTLTADDVASHGALLADADAVVGQFEVPAAATLAAFRLAHNRSIQTILNAAPGEPLSKAWIPVVDHLVVNESEVELIGRAAGLSAEAPTAWAESLQRLGYSRVVLTLGSQGAYVVTDDERAHVPAWSVGTIDTTGAGDGFVGGLAVALAEGLGLGAAVRFACAVGALATTAVGAQAALPDRAEVSALLTAA